MENKSASALFSTRSLAKIAILGALAGALMYLEFVIPPFPTFYKLDFSDIPALLGAFAMGPAEGVLIEAVKIFIKFLIKPTSTLGIGELANFTVGCALVLPAGMIYKRNKTRKTALIGMAAGTLIMTLIGAAFNYFVLIPVYAKAFGMEAILGMASAIAGIKDLGTLVVFGTIPFNLIKGVIVSVITILLYKKVSPLLHR
ncbi:MAG: ECF transporter S component [Solobacterium sp.]|nr:ECF transporter S component [Solobacterium sp.]